MSFADHILMRITIFFLGIFGFWVARHIRKHKLIGKPLICPIKFDCNSVVNSDYSKFFGIPVEILGMIYYGLIFTSYFFFIVFPHLLPNTVVGFMVFLTVTAFLFSVYLIGVQIFVLRKGCSWCIVSAFISALIFIFVIFTYDFSDVVQIFI